MDMKVERALSYCRDQHIPVSIEVTNICSARCSFCWYRKGGDWRKPGLISDRVFDRFLFLLEEHAGPGEVVNLSTAHGDVLTNKRLPELIRKITSVKDVSGVPFFTNGILLHRFDLAELLELKIHHANFSTAIGNEEQYRRLYGRDCYRRTFENILEFIVKNNQNGHGKIPVRVLLRVDKPFSKVLDSEDFRVLSRQLGRHRISFLEEWDDYNGLVKEKDLPRGGHMFKKTRPIASIPCYALYRKLEVLKDGEISCCICRLSKDLIVGNIFESKSLSEVWLGDPLERLRQHWFEGRFPEICATCSHYQPVTDLYQSMKRVKNPFLRYIDLIKYRLGNRSLADSQ